MMGRALFAAVWLIVGAGLLLPVYAPDGAGPGPAPTGGALLVAAAGPTDCPACAKASAGDTICHPACPCSHVQAAGDDVAEDPAGQIIYLVVQPGPSDRVFEPQPLPPKLPAI